MKVNLRKIDSIRPYERNPRLNDDAVDAVAASIREFGFRQAIVVDAEGWKPRNSRDRTPEAPFIGGRRWKPAIP